MKRRLRLTAISTVVVFVTLYVSGYVQGAERESMMGPVDVSLHLVPTTTMTTKLKRNCGIPDSIPWGHYKIFLYQKGIDAEFARKDSIINHWRDSVKIARGL